MYVYRGFIICVRDVIVDSAGVQLQCFAGGNLDQGIGHGHTAGNTACDTTYIDPAPVVAVGTYAGDSCTYAAAQ